MTRRLAGMAVCFFLVLVAMCGCVSALELTVGTPNATVNDTVFEIPVILKNNDIDFAGFTCEVDNAVDGAKITVLEDVKPLKDDENTVFRYIINSGENNPYQRIVAYSLKSTSAPELHLFTIQVNITDPSISTVPLNISLREIVLNDNTEYPLSSVTTSGLSSIKLREGVTAAVTTEAEERLIPELMVSSATVVPTTSDRTSASGYQSQSQTQGQSQTQILDSSSSSTSTSTSSSSSSSANAPVPLASGSSSTTATKSSPGFGFALIISGLGVASALLLKRKMN